MRKKDSSYHRLAKRLGNMQAVLIGPTSPAKIQVTALEMETQFVMENL